METTGTSLSERIRTLTSEQLAEVERFVDLVQKGAHDPSLCRASAALSEPAFEAIWNNPLDDAYDVL